MASILVSEGGVAIGNKLSKCLRISRGTPAAEPLQSEAYIGARGRAQGREILLRTRTTAENSKLFSAPKNLFFGICPIAKTRAKQYARDLSKKRLPALKIISLLF